MEVSRVSQLGAEAAETSLTPDSEAVAGETSTHSQETEEESPTTLLVTEEGETREALATAQTGAEEVIIIKGEVDSVEVTIIIMMEITPSMMTRGMMIWTWKMTTKSIRSKVFLIGEDLKATIKTLVKPHPPIL